MAPSLNAIPPSAEVGSMSEAARSVKDSWQEGSPSMILDQTLFHPLG